MASVGATGGAQRSSLKRSNTTKSSAASTASSIHDPRSGDYWNNLLCMFFGLSIAPEARGATSLNNKDNFRNKLDAHSTSPRPSTTASSSGTPKRSGSFLRSSLSKKRSNPSRSSFFSRKGRHSLSDNESALGSVPEASILPTESQMRQDATRDYVGHRSTRSPTVSSTASEPRMVAVLKDGQTHWIPESVVAQYLGGIPQRSPSPPQFTVPRRSSMRHSRRPGMHISIPSTGSSPRPEDVCDARPIQRGVRRPTHPLERTSYDTHTPPGLESDASSAYSPEVQSPLSQYGTSQSSLSEVTTPQDAPVGNRYFQVIDPNVEGVFDEACWTPSMNDFGMGDLHKQFGELVAPLSPPALPQRSQKRMTCESGPESGNDSPGSDAKSINELSSVASKRGHSEAAAGEGDQIEVDAAEAVIFAILSSAESVNDLFHCALLNKGFYSVYKRNEHALIKNVFAMAAL